MRDRAIRTTSVKSTFYTKHKRQIPSTHNLFLTNYSFLFIFRAIYSVSFSTVFASPDLRPPTRIQIFYKHPTIPQRNLCSQSHQHSLRNIKSLEMSWCHRPTCNWRRHCPGHTSKRFRTISPMLVIFSLLRSLFTLYSLYSSKEISIPRALTPFFSPAHETKIVRCFGRPSKEKID